MDTLKTILFVMRCVFIRRIPILFAIFVCVTQIISGCMQFRMSHKKMNHFFASCSPALQSIYYTAEGRQMHCVTMPENNKTPLLFVHGSPGAWDAFKNYFKKDSLVQKYKLMSIDRPGFGYSDFGKQEISLEKQAACIAPVLKQQKQSVILVGHSLGGPVIARLAMDYPEQVKALVFIAPSIDPSLEKTKWIQYPAHWKATRWLVPRVLRVCNEEILPLKKELEKMLPLWKNITVPVVFIQGGKDKLVPKENLDFARKVLTETQIKEFFYPEYNHFIPFTHPDIVEKAILQLD
jgi:pimeloyl-ACP methyl ester carboxylesterase